MRAILACLFLCTALSAAQAAEPSPEMIAHGKALVDAGDCYSCHTSDPAKPFAGGVRIETPFGAITSPNLTPDRETGIGAWSEQDFYRALRSGIAPDGSRYYPAFPYPFFTKLTRDDILAIRAWLGTLTPYANKAPAPELRFPLNFRVVMRVWDYLFFRPGILEPDQGKGTEWNRGRYLVEALGHCGACHTPKNLFGADRRNRAFAGGLVDGWFAPRLDAAERSGLASWKVDDIVEYLSSGRNQKSHAGGPMAEVVVNSTSKMSDADLHAIAVYLKSLPSGNSEPVVTPPLGSHDGFGQGGLRSLLHLLPRGRRVELARRLSAARRQCAAAIGRSLLDLARHPRRRADRDHVACAEYRADAGLRTTVQ